MAENEALLDEMADSVENRDEKEGDAFVSTSEVVVKVAETIEEENNTVRAPRRTTTTRLVGNSSSNGSGSLLIGGGGRSGGDGLLNVGTRNLEAVLNSINKTLKRHDQEIRNPVWMDTVRSEFEALARVRRRIDLAETDINYIRGVLYTSGEVVSGIGQQQNTTNALDESDWGAILDDLKAPTEQEVFIANLQTLESTIRSEIESLRHVGRRLELHKALESVMIPHIERLSFREAEHDLRIVELEKSEAVQDLKMEVHNDIDELRGEIEDIGQDLSEQRNSFTFRIDTIEQQSKTISKMLTGDMSDGGDDDDDASDNNGMSQKIGGKKGLLSLKDAEKRFVSKEMFESGGNMLQLIETCTKRCTRLEKIQMMEMMALVFIRFHTLTALNTTKKLKRSWFKWIQVVHDFNEARNKLLRGAGGRAIMTMRKFLVGGYVALFFNKWKNHVHTRAQFEDKKTYLCDIVSYWISRLPQNINIKPFWIRWKRHSKLSTLLAFTKATSSNAVHRSTIITSEGTKKHPDISHHNTPLGQASKLVESMHDDDHGRIISLGFFIENLNSFVHESLTKINYNTDQIKSVSSALGSIKQDTGSDLKGRLDLIEKKTKAIDTHFSVRVDAHDKLIEKNDQNSCDRHVSIQNMFEEHNLRLEKLEGMKIQTDNKLKSIMILQGELIERVSNVEKKQQSLTDDMKHVTKIADDVSLTSNIMNDSIASVENKLSANIKNIESDINALRESTSEADIFIAEVSGIAHLNKDNIISNNSLLSERLRNLQDYVQHHVPIPPSATELVQLCLRYETKVEQSIHEGALSHDFPPQLSNIVAKFAQRLAANISHNADMMVLNSIIVGPRKLPPKSDKEGPIAGSKPGDLKPSSSANGNGNGSLEVTADIGDGSPEDDAYAMREELVQKFHEEFCILLENNKLQGKTSSKSRIEARTIFHRRFLLSLDLALSKHDSTVMSVPSSFGNRPASQTGGTCVACDRPLRIRYRAKPMTYLHSQQSLLEAGVQQSFEEDIHRKAFMRMGASTTGVLSSNGDKDRDREGVEETSNFNQTSSTRQTRPLSSSSTKANTLTGNGNTYGRPASAGASRHRTAVKQAAVGDSYVMRGGFRMPVVREQDLLAKKLSGKFQKDWSIGKSHQIFPDPALSNMFDTFDGDGTGGFGGVPSFGAPLVDVPAPQRSIESLGDSVELSAPNSPILAKRKSLHFDDKTKQIPSIHVGFDQQELDAEKQRLLMSVSNSLPNLKL
jgi:hypothetical protein